MELIGKCYILNEDQQKQFAAKSVKQMGLIVGGVFVGMMVLFIFIKMPMFLFGSVIPTIALLFLIMTVARYFVVLKMATGYMLCFDEDRISVTYDKDKLGVLISGASKLGEARHGTRTNQHIPWRNIDYITHGSKGMKIYSKNFDMLNGNGCIDIPIFLDDFEGIKHFFETKYSGKINN